MQTWMPCAGMRRSLEALDVKRLNAQCNKALQLLRTQPGEPWSNHPARQMWRGYEPALAAYRNLAVSIWAMKRPDGAPSHTRRYCKSNGDLHGETVTKYAAKAHLDAWYELPRLSLPLPPWLGDHRFHRAHRAILLSKNESRYRKLWDWPDTPCECGNMRSGGGCHSHEFVPATPWPELDVHGGYRMRWGLRAEPGARIHYVYDEEIER